MLEARRLDEVTKLGGERDGKRDPGHKGLPVVGTGGLKLVNCLLDAQPLCSLRKNLGAWFGLVGLGGDWR